MSITSSKLQRATSSFLTFLRAVFVVSVLGGAAVAVDNKYFWGGYLVYGAEWLYVLVTGSEADLLQLENNARYWHLMGWKKTGVVDYKNPENGRGILAYFVDGELYREDGPAETFYENGKKHRERWSQREDKVESIYYFENGNIETIYYKIEDVEQEELCKEIFFIDGSISERHWCKNPS